MKKKAGFTLIEFLITTTITVLLTSVLLVYNRSQELPLLLFREQSNVFAAFNRVKSLSLQAFSESDEVPCGIGVRVEPDNNRYFIFSDFESDCSLSDHQFQSSKDAILSGADYSLDSKIIFNISVVTDIVFVPPDPQIYVNGSLAGGLTDIRIQAVSDPNLYRTITINNAGQISTQ